MPPASATTSNPPPALPADRPSSGATEVLVVPPARNGPPAMANGGWVVGRLAELVDAPAATVTLRAPTPVGTRLGIARTTGGLELRHGGDLLAEAVAADRPVAGPAPVALGDVAVAETRFLGHHHHPFPGCFVCGTDRLAGDGLRIFPGPVPGRPGAVASWWVPSTDLAGPDGTLPARVVGAALDCPTAWAHLQPGEACLLGRMTLAHHAEVRPGRDHVVVAEATGRDGRKWHATSALYDERGRCLATAATTWIQIPA